MKTNNNIITFMFRWGGKSIFLPRIIILGALATLSVHAIADVKRGSEIFEAKIKAHVKIPDCKYEISSSDFSASLGYEHSGMYLHAVTKFDDTPAGKISINALGVGCRVNKVELSARHNNRSVFDDNAIEDLSYVILDPKHSIAYDLALAQGSSITKENGVTEPIDGVSYKLKGQERNAGTVGIKKYQKYVLINGLDPVKKPDSGDMIKARGPVALLMDETTAILPSTTNNFSQLTIIGSNEAKSMQIALHPIVSYFIYNERGRIEKNLDYLPEATHISTTLTITAS